MKRNANGRVTTADALKTARFPLTNGSNSTSAQNRSRPATRSRGISEVEFTQPKTTSSGGTTNSNGNNTSQQRPSGLPLSFEDGPISLNSADLRNAKNIYTPDVKKMMNGFDQTPTPSMEKHLVKSEAAGPAPPSSSNAQQPTNEPPNSSAMPLFPPPSATAYQPFSTRPDQTLMYSVSTAASATTKSSVITSSAQHLGLPPTSAAKVLTLPVHSGHMPSYGRTNQFSNDILASIISTGAGGFNNSSLLSSKDYNMHRPTRQMQNGLSSQHQLTLTTSTGGFGSDLSGDGPMSLGSNGTSHNRTAAKREKNRAAAKRCREKKIKRISDLSEQVAKLKRQNSQLCDTLQALEEEVDRLKNKITHHKTNGCDFSPEIEQYLT